MCGVPLPWWVEEIEKDKEENPDIPVPEKGEGGRDALHASRI